MARNTPTGISGLIGTLEFYNRNGKNYVRKKKRGRPKKRGQPANPLNTIFGDVSTYGTPMIKLAKDYSLFPFVQDTYNTARGWMRDNYALHKDDGVWKLEECLVTSCQLNPEADLRSFISRGIVITDEGAGTVSVDIPAINPRKEIRAGAGTTAVKIKLIVVSSAFNSRNRGTKYAVEEYSFNYTGTVQPAKKITLSLVGSPAPIKDSIAIVIMALEFETRQGAIRQYNMDKKMLPVGIIGMGRLGE